ncbi:type I-F CRISPR-associated protein Csy2 [Melaminivora alkalimesophila]|uniref:CRISPR-associated Csy2 family protein n=1 Tax=Melaminivora alkalimesophila TaxID=1165852 RepID=A0A317RBY7_9BURK|nr:type I-F CRISPR-associated protein Csy2 [Melaminivora alkalimesophila]PWW46868.1 CRISPR-associated Csy2 family protein [Melaminivora alkalimesophila]
MSHPSPQAVLVLPRLRIQNANAIGSPLTHGFPSITAFTGLMWALERRLAQAGVPLRLHGTGVVCHRYQEQVTEGYVRSFNLTRNPVDKDGSTAAIVEEGRMHLEITLVLSVSEKKAPSAAPALVQGNETQLAAWAHAVGETLAGMRVAGGSVLPSRPVPGKRVRPWIGIVPDEPQEASRLFRLWRRQWLPGFALVGRDDLLAARLEHLRTSRPHAGVLDAWLHAVRFNHQPLPCKDGAPVPDGKIEWGDPLRPKGSGWVVPIPVGYAALGDLHAAGCVRNARDAEAPVRFVESVYSLGQWISPHRLNSLQQLLWHAETDETLGLYRCRSGYRPDPSVDTEERAADASAEWDDADAFA